MSLRRPFMRRRPVASFSILALRVRGFDLAREALRDLQVDGLILEIDDRQVASHGDQVVRVAVHLGGLAFVGPLELPLLGFDADGPRDSQRALGLRRRVGERVLPEDDAVLAPSRPARSSRGPWSCWSGGGCARPLPPRPAAAPARIGTRLPRSRSPGCPTGRCACRGRVSVKSGMYATSSLPRSSGPAGYRNRSSATWPISAAP